MREFENIMHKNGVKEDEDAADVLYAVYEIMLYVADKMGTNYEAGKIREAAEEVVRIYFNYKEHREYEQKQKEVSVIYGQIMKAFLPELFCSDEMVVYLVEHLEEFSKYQILDTISGAPIPLKRKLEMLKEFLPYENLEEELLQSDMEEEWIYDNSFQNYISNLEEAIKGLELKSGEIFILYVNNGGTDNKVLDTRAFQSYAKVREWMNSQECKWYEEDFGEMLWYTLEKWEADGRGNFVNKIDYYIQKGDVTNYKYNAYGLGRDDLFAINANVNLPVPFQCGDILEIDARPFYEKMRVLIVNIGDNQDCCCVQALYVDQEGELDSGALKHGMIFKDTWPVQSPLYSARIYEGELEEEEKVFLKLQKFLKENITFWNEISETLPLHGMTREQIENGFLENFKEGFYERDKR